MKTPEVGSVNLTTPRENISQNLPDPLRNGDHSLVSKKAVGSHLAQEHMENIQAMVKPPIQEPATKVELSPKARELSKIEKAPGLKKPAIFFIRGFEVIGSDGGGLKQMSEGLKGSEYFSWRDEEKIVNEIKKRALGQPVILIGYGMGGDTAVNISNTLNSPSHGFRKVNLLVTMDSVGVNNDIIPQNVARNLNFISDEGGLFSDGPNIARKAEHTNVENFLQDDGDMIGSSDVQFKIFDSINQILS